MAFIKVIHCSMGVAKNYQEAKYKGRFGSMVTTGHVDFYRMYFSLKKLRYNVRLLNYN